MALPNLLAALTAHTRTFPDIMALVQGRITAGRLRTQTPEDPSGWVMPTGAIVYRIVPGPSFRPLRVPVRGQTVQAEWYGTDLRMADLLYRTWYSDFFPFDSRIAQGFISNNCAVISIQEMGSPASFFEGESDWPRSVGTLFIRYSEIPTNVQFGSASLAATGGP